MTVAEREGFQKNGFTQDQIDEIEAGRNEGLNTSVYENPAFLSIQMRQIRMGLTEGLQVEHYAKVEYDWFQMEEIREGLKAGINISLYASVAIPYEKMRQIRKGLINGINLTPYLRLQAGVIRQLRKAILAGVNILKYINEGYDAEQLAEIREALVKEIDIDPYLSKEYRAASIVQIRKGVERRIDVSLYANICYSWRQMREIRKGLENRIDVNKYIGHLYSWEQMREVRLGLEQGLDVDGYRLLRYTAGEMQKKRLAMLEAIRLEQEAILESQLKSEDLMFEFTAGGMEAYITVLAEGKVITREKLLESLEQNGVCKGIVEDTVEQIVSGKYGKRAMLIAKGQIPYKGEDGWYEFFFRTNMEKRPKVLSDGSVDYQNIEWFEMVCEGQKLAFYHEAKEGIDGYNVAGNVITARKGFEKRVLVGQGFKLEEDKKTYIATMDGMVRLEENELKVTNHMVLDEVTMATGNVKFSGSIHVLGDVSSGTMVQADGDVMVDGNVEAAIIISGGSIILKKGMNSAGRGMIDAGKDVVSRFFESVKVVAKGNIEVDKCLNSQLHAGNKIISTRVIAGGVVQAEKGFRVHHVGNHAGIPTLLKLKVNDKVWEEHRNVRAALRDAMQELQLLNNAYEDFKFKFPPEIRNNMEMFTKVEKAVFTKAKQIEQLQGVNKELEDVIRESNEAKVIIAGQAHEGTILEMGGCRWAAENQYNITVKKQDHQMEVLTNR